MTMNQRGSMPVNFFTFKDVKERMMLSKDMYGLSMN